MSYYSDISYKAFSSIWKYLLKIILIFPQFVNDFLRHSFFGFVYFSDSF